MPIAVTGATGHLGSLIIDALLKRHVAPSEIVALVRNPEKASDLAQRGIAIAEADYGDKDALIAALSGVERLVLVSSSEIGKRATQHRNVIEAAQAAGVSFIAYTSLLHAATSPLSLAEEHTETEAILDAADMSFVSLRNGWYWENFVGAVDAAKTGGHTFGASGEGRVSGAARKDYAEAAAAVITSDPLLESGTRYELAGEVALDAAGIAKVISELLGREVTYVNQTPEEYTETLGRAGLPVPVAQMIAGWESGIAKDGLYSEDNTLRLLIGHPATSLAEVLEGELANR